MLIAVSSALWDSMRCHFFLASSVHPIVLWEPLEPFSFHVLCLNCPSWTKMTKLVAAAATAISCTNAPGSVFPIELHLQHVNLTCIIQQLNLTWFIRSCMISAYPGLQWPHWTWLLVRLRWSAFKKQLTERWRSCWPAKRANSWVGKVGYVTRWCSHIVPPSN